MDPPKSLVAVPDAVTRTVNAPTDGVILNQRETLVVWVVLLAAAATELTVLDKLTELNVTLLVVIPDPVA